MKTMFHRMTDMVQQTSLILLSLGIALTPVCTPAAETVARKCLRDQAGLYDFSRCRPVWPCSMPTVNGPGAVEQGHIDMGWVARLGGKARTHCDGNPYRGKDGRSRGFPPVWRY